MLKYDTYDTIFTYDEIINDDNDCVIITIYLDSN